MKTLLLLSILLVNTSVSAIAQQTFFNRDFAPADAFVKPQEKPCREDVCLNGSWKFFPVYDADKLTVEKIKNPSIPANTNWESTPVKVPSPWNVNSFACCGGGDFITYPEYPEQWEKAKAGWMKRTLPYRSEWKNKRIILHFEAVSGYTQVYINQKKVAENFDLFLPFEIDITDQVKENTENELLVWVADAKLFNQTSPALKYGRRIHVGGSFWGEHAVGIWQDVNLIVKPAISISNIFIKPDVQKDELVIEAVISNKTSKKQQLTLSGNIMPWINKAGTSPVSAPEINWELGTSVLNVTSEKIELEPSSSKTIYMTVPVTGKLKQWNIEDPNLYGLVLELAEKKQTIDKQYERFGWRQFTISGNQFLLNGKPITLKGDSWHFMGIPQMTRRYAWAWFDMLKKAHGNAVRLHAQPYPSFYLDLADEMGVFVLDETGMWASDGGPLADSEDYWKNSEDHLRRMIMRDRNHPSVFGWSVCNENLPVVINVQRASEAIIQRQIDEINKWVAITKELDPTRDWISGDGETNKKTQLPVVLGHYGHEKEMQKWSTEYPIWGIGEQGMGYAGTPHEASGYIGNRAYESMQGRMEGVAAEAVALLNLQKKYKANFLSVFNVAWYGLKPLELGMKDTTKVPTKSDGIFFNPYQEGKPGVQPGRLGPYTTTFNPGYDPQLPPFKTWPLYDVVGASYATENAIVSPWKPTEVSAEALKKTPVTSITVLSGNAQSGLFTICSDLGINIQKQPAKSGKTLLIIDGKNPPVDKQAISAIQTALKNGGQVMIWGVSPESIEKLNPLLPYPVQLTERTASSFLIKNTDPIVAGLGNADFYFTENSNQEVMNYGIEGAFVKNGTVLLEASNTNWRKWNHQAEFFKTGSILRSERESKKEGKALVKTSSGNGAIYLCSLEPDTINKYSPMLLKKLFSNMGIQFGQGRTKEISALNDAGVLKNALILGAFNTIGKTFWDIIQTDYLKNTQAKDYLNGAETQGRFWDAQQSTDGIFDFTKMKLQGSSQHAVAYVSFWIYSPRSLTNLLIAPDMPRLNMYIGADDACQVNLNGQLLKDYIREGSLKKRDQQIQNVPLEKGWNHFLIKVIQGGGSWQLAVEFDCDKPGFMKELKTDIQHNN